MQAGIISIKLSMIVSAGSQTAGGYLLLIKNTMPIISHMRFRVKYVSGMQLYQ